MLTCFHCQALLRPLFDCHRWQGCSCGVRRMQKEIISLEDLLTSSGSYKDRINSPELTNQLKDNGVLLINKVNQLLTDLNINKVKVSSGFRPSDVNSKTPNAAKRSAHQSCKAVDLMDDKDQSIGHLIASNPGLLRKLGLFMEDLNSTKGQYTNWVHLDYVDRADRPSRIFKP
jgi:hypothetical protein